MREKEEGRQFYPRALSKQWNNQDLDPCRPENQQGWTLEEPTTLGTAKRILFIVTPYTFSSEPGKNPAK